MARKNLLAMQIRMEKQAQLIPTKMMAAFVIALKDAEVPDEDIEYLLQRVQQAWCESVEKDVDICEYCLEETGFDVRPYVSEKR